MRASHRYYVHHHRKRLQVFVGFGCGVGLDDGGRLDGAELGADDGVIEGAGFERGGRLVAVADGVAASVSLPLSFLSLADSEADGDTEIEEEGEAAPRHRRRTAWRSPSRRHRRLPSRPRRPRSWGWSRVPLCRVRRGSARPRPAAVRHPRTARAYGAADGPRPCGRDDPTARLRHRRRRRRARAAATVADSAPARTLPARPRPAVRLRRSCRIPDRRRGRRHARRPHPCGRTRVVRRPACRTPGRRGRR
ncbi:hypothetical protein MBT84_29120 [Streptomyces sp. MBT84]|nr:hypothetical protein [Streptomyces sp. MBT84]